MLIVKKILILLIPLLLIAPHLGGQIHLWYQIRREIDQIQTKIIVLKKENRLLNQKANYYRSKEFICREAREKLAMTKKNELLFLIPTPPDFSLLQPKGKKYYQEAPWRQWYQLFFGEKSP